MSAATNKQLMQAIFSELEKGTGQLFIESMAEDFQWHMTGTTAWSGTYRGRKTVQERLLKPLMAQFSDRYTNSATRILADDEYVVVECRGRSTTRTGKPYNNVYCWVCRLDDGKLKELTEYMDTELVSSVLEAPAIPE